MKYSKELNEIYESINNGIKYGEDLENVRFPIFWEVLSANKYYIFWRNYGSSANKNTKKNLLWIITNIFNTTPEQFINDYITSDKSKFN